MLSSPYIALSIGQRFDAKMDEGWFDTKRRIPEIQAEIGFDQTDMRTLLYILNRHVEQGRLVLTYNDGLFHFHLVTDQELAQRKMRELLLSGWFAKPRRLRDLMEATAGYDRCAILDQYLTWCQSGYQGREDYQLLNRWTGRDGQGYFCSESVVEVYRQGTYTINGMLPSDIAKQFRRAVL